MHATLRLQDGLPSLRVPVTYVVLKEAMKAGCLRAGFRLVHFSVQGNHLHLIVEADDRRALRAGVAGMMIRVARALNRHWSRTGPVFGDRYHTTVLATPRQTRNAIAYVLNNARRHAAQRGRVLPRGWLDPYSTAASFPGWDRKTRAPSPVATPTAWLLTTGWRRGGGTIPIDHVPSA